MASDEEMATLSASLAATISVLAGQIPTLRSRLEAQQQALFNAVSDQSTQTVALAAHLNELSDLIDEVNDNAAIAFGAVDTVRDAIELLAPASEDGVQPLEEKIESLSDVMQERIDHSKETIDQFLEAQREALDAAVVQAGEELKDALSGELMEKVSEFLEELQEAVSEHAESLMAPLAAEIGDAVERVLNTLTEDLARGDNETKRENAALSAAVDALKPAVDGLLDQFKRVTSLAETVGL